MTTPAAVEQTFAERLANTHHVFMVPLTEGASARLSDIFSSFEEGATFQSSTFLDVMQITATPVLVLIVEGRPKPDTVLRWAHDDMGTPIEEEQ